MAQRVVERVVRARWRATPCGSPGCRALALAGGVVSNVKATRHVRLLPEVEDVYVFPHMGDGGLALGAAVVAAAGARRRRCDSTSPASTSVPRSTLRRSNAALPRGGSAPIAGRGPCASASPTCSTPDAS